MDVMPTRMVKAGQTVFREGELPDDGLYFICYGSVEISRKENGKDRILAELSEGSVFGEMALINNTPRNATVTAKTDCGFYNINRANFQHQVNQLEPVMRGVFRVFVLTIRDFLQQYDAEAEAKRKEAEGVSYEPVKGGMIGKQEEKSSLVSGQERKLQF